MVADRRGAAQGAKRKHLMERVQFERLPLRCAVVKDGVRIGWVRISAVLSYLVSPEYDVVTCDPKTGRLENHNSFPTESEAMFNLLWLFFREGDARALHARWMLEKDGGA